MSRGREESYGPTPSAGLLRFFQEEANGPKIAPELVIIFGVALVIAVVLAHVFYPNFV